MSVLQDEITYADVTILACMHSYLGRWSVRQQSQPQLLFLAVVLAAFFGAIYLSLLYFWVYWVL